MDDTQIDSYSQRVDRYSERIGDFDRLCLRLKADKECNNSDTGVVSWLDRYFESVSLRVGSRKQLEYPRSQIKDDSIDLTISLKMFSQEASCVAGNWTDVKRKYDDRRSFRGFLLLLDLSGLDTYPFKKDNGYQLSRRLLPRNKWADVVIADPKYHDGSLSLIQLLRRIHSESIDDFRREQAKLMESFLDDLINIQKEQLHVAYSFSERLERLRRFDVVSSSSNVVDDDDGFVWTQENILDSIYIMSRESSWLLESLDSGFTSHLTHPSIKEFSKIICLVLDFVSEAKNHSIHDVRERIRSVKEQGVERESVVEMLLGCFADVFDTLQEPLMPSSLQTAGDTYYSLESAFHKAVIDTSELMSETENKLSLVYCSDLTSGGSPLGCIVLWRILFESSLIDLRLDRIYKKLSETTKLGFKLVEAASKKRTRNERSVKLRVFEQLNLTNAQLDRLLKACSRVLDECVAMEETVAKVTYTLGDAFTTGGAGTRGLSAASSLNVDYSSVVADDFPWDKHTVRLSDGKNATRCCCRDYDVDGLGSRRWFRKRYHSE